MTPPFFMPAPWNGTNENTFVLGCVIMSVGAIVNSKAIP
jgi:hypothetical protein